MFRSAILTLGLVAFVLGLTGCGGSEQPKAAPPGDQEKARGGPRDQPGGAKGTNQ